MLLLCTIAALVLYTEVLLLVGCLLGQYSVWRWLRKEFGVPKVVPVSEYLKRLLARSA